jgi:cytochrome c biogenesis protein ResB
VTLLDEGSEILSGDIEMNGPLIYKGIAFYHMSHGQMPMGLVLRVDGAINEIPFDSGFTTKKGKGFKFGKIFPDFARDASGNGYSRTSEFRNPYQEIISKDGTRGYLNISRPGEVVSIEDVEIVLQDYILKEYAVLGINKDPGIWFIIVGSSILTFGVILIFLFRGSRAELMRKPQENII